MISGFKWILPKLLAGSARPGLLAELDDDLAYLREVGIRRIVTLTTRPLAPAAEAAGFEVVHFPISDMGIPTPRAAEPLCRQIVADLAERPTLLHCKGGIGRTGTIAACCLVSLGQDPDEALINVRRVNPLYVQNALQAGFIKHYADWLRSASASPM